MLKLIMTTKPIISYLTWAIGGKQVMGGIRVILEQTHHLLERGYHVNILTHQSKEIPWFDSKIKPIVIPEFSTDIPKTDILVASYWPTAYEVNNFTDVRKYYLVQHYEPLFENNSVAFELAKNTYRLPLKKLTVSHWISDKLEKETQQKSSCISNAIQPQKFQLPEGFAVNKPEKTQILAVASDMARWKGIEELFLVFKKLKETRTDIEITFITSDKRINSHHKQCIDNFIVSPIQEALIAYYQRADLFIHTSYYEGFGLPPLEAMAANTCIVAVDSGGINDYAKHNENAIIVPARDYDALFLSIYFLLDRPAIREKLAFNAQKTAQQFTWNKVIDKLENIFLEDSSN
ncbi:MAG: hypothetical protein DKM50_03890 [Candidatus Margulisiibacteriota bacterium]|nr:MAG: hypothetical protein A2X43_01605 [Candidatus Margulisbacteria bacterium GWD2_39_127]OGI05519.1 MAG: hypothetical protein A2X42_00230 [Candidatus Margulisbacteria bacterium GWF2_38_17]PZM82277.1 MAG: hypothetical protein DKM50_03890 [Candidatus Margulisiibacteriota bacterium]HAR62977.1 hypothetical protein [Candidatus Margulisiibacteriota bacterium]HCT83947.1 hypothetical protein [Candidatus Margulisiibacteriota bacterium]